MLLKGKESNGRVLVQGAPHWIYLYDYTTRLSNVQYNFIMANDILVHTIMGTGIFDDCAEKTPKSRGLL